MSVVLSLGRIKVAQGKKLQAQGRILVAQGRILVAQGRLLVAQGTILVAQGSISGFGKNNNEDMSQKDQGMTARKPSKHIISDSGKNKSF